MFPMVHGIYSQGGEPAPAPSGWWDDNGNISGALAAWQAKGASSYAASLEDLTGNGHTLVERNGTVPWSAEAGWEFGGDAEAKALDTMIIPDEGYSVLVQFADNTPVNNATLIGLTAVTGGSNNYHLMPARFANHAYTVGTERQVASNLTAGNMGLAGYSCYLNGASDGTITPGTPSFLHTMTIGAGKRRDAGDGDEMLIAFYVTADIIAVAIYDTVLSAEDMATIAGNMAAL